MHLWSKCGNPDFNQWWLITRTNSQTQNGVNFDFEMKFDLKGQGQSPPKTIGILTKVFYTYGLNLVILAWTGYRAYKLGHGQTDWRMDRRRQGQYPEAQEISRNLATLEVTNLKSLFSRRHASIFNCWVPMPSFSSGLFRHTVRWKSRLRWIDPIPCLHTRPTWEVTWWHHNMETWWRHDKERRSSLFVLCEGNHRWFSS